MGILYDKPLQKYKKMPKRARLGTKKNGETLRQRKASLIRL